MSTPFPGNVHYLDAAREAGGYSESARLDAQRQPAVSQVATLVVQCLDGAPHPDSIARCRSLRDGLFLAAEAARQMVDLIEPAAVTVVKAEPVVKPEPSAKGKAKG